MLNDKILDKAVEEGIITEDFASLIKEVGFQNFCENYDLNSNEEVLEFLEDFDEYEFCVCQECNQIIETLDIPLCGKCAEKYDLEKFWIKHDLEVGDWHEPCDFNENEDIKELYLKQPLTPNEEGMYNFSDTVVSNNDIKEFKSKHSNYFEDKEVEDYTIAQIINEMKNE